MLLKLAQHARFWPHTSWTRVREDITSRNSLEGGCKALINLLNFSSSSTATAQVGRLNHVAIAVPNLETATKHYRDVLGAKVSAPQPVPEHGVTVVFVELPNTKIELLEPLGDNSPIANFLQRNPSGGIHHMCLEVSDIKDSLAALTHRMRVLTPEPKIGAHGNPVVFLHPKDNCGVLMELEQVTGST